MPDMVADSFFWHKKSDPVPGKKTFLPTIWCLKEPMMYNFLYNSGIPEPDVDQHRNTALISCLSI